MNATRRSSRERPASRSQAALLALCLTGMLLGIQLPVATSMGGGSANDVQGVVFVTHHKTGTSLIGCIVGVIQHQLESACNHALLPIYLNQQLDSVDVAFYLDVAKANAFRRGAQARPPFLMLKTGSAPNEVCFDTAGIAKHAVVSSMLSGHKSAAESGARCRDPCPCHEGVTNCLDLGACYSTEPLSQLFWVHVIRNPINIVISAYNYHRIDPPIEEWLGRVKVIDLANWLASSGVDKDMLTAVGVYLPKYSQMTYWQYLQAVPEAQGLQMEFLRSSYDMWKMARLHQRMSHFDMNQMIVRYEDLETDAMSAMVKPVLSTCKMDQPCLNATMDTFEAYMKGRCIPKTWTPSRRMANSHIGNYTHHDKERQKAVLLQNRYVLEHLCRLEALLGYSTLQDVCLL